MKVREFLIENEKGEQFDLNDYKKGCLLTNPSELGYSNESEFERIGNTFVESNRTIERKNLSGVLNFNSYDKCKEFIDFIELSNKLKFIYKIPFLEGEKAYYRDISIKEFTKTEKEIKRLACPIIFNTLSLWYEKSPTIYNIQRQEDEIRWDFIWDSRFLSNTSNNIEFNNKGHIPARVLIEVDGYVLNPIFKVEQNGKTLFELPITVTIDVGEKLIYSTMENDFYIKKINMITDEETELYTLDNIDFNKDYILKLPLGESSLTILTEDILNQAKITIYSYYKAI